MRIGERVDIFGKPMVLLGKRSKNNKSDDCRCEVGNTGFEPVTPTLSR